MHELLLLYCCNVALDYSGTGYFSSARKFVTLTMTEVPLLTVGKVFDSIDDAKACVQNYNETKFTNFVVVSNNKKTLLYSCRHTIERKSSSSGQRPNQHYNFVGCAAHICMYKARYENLTWSIPTMSSTKQRTASTTIVWTKKKVT